MSISVKAVSAKLEGLMVFHVRRSIGSIFFLELGTPSLDVREPQPELARKARSQKLRDNWKRRCVTIKGTHTIWLDYGYWRCEQRGKQLFDCDSEATKIDTGFHQHIVGQKVEHVRYSPRTDETTFAFDLGSRIILRPYFVEEWDDDPEPLSLWSFCHNDARNRIATLYEGESELHYT